MRLSEKQVRKLVLPISLIMLIGGIIGAIYCAHEIDELLDWAESTGNPNMTKEYKYQVVAEEVRSLSLWQGGSADIAVIGGLVSLALVFRRRFRWEEARGLPLSLLGALVILLAILGALYVSQQVLAFSNGIVAATMAILLFLAILGSIRKRLPLRESFFVLGGFLMLVGIFGATQASTEEIREITQEYQLLFLFLTLISFGIAVLGTFFILGALCWPRQKADKLEILGQA